MLLLHKADVAARVILGGEKKGTKANNQKSRPPRVCRKNICPEARQDRGHSLLNFFEQFLLQPHFMMLHGISAPSRAETTLKPA